MSAREQSHGWCSMRLRFEDRELVLLRCAEQLRGRALARDSQPRGLRTALNLAKAGYKLGVASPGAPVVLEETEVGLLLEALRFAHAEIQWAARAGADQDVQRHEAVLTSFPELSERGGWRSFGLTRELETLAGRLQTALAATNV